MHTRAKTKPRIGIFTRPIDQGTSGSGHHLLEIVRHVLAANADFELFLIHYERNEKAIYREAPELIVPRNPLAAARVLAPYGFDVLHYSPLTVHSPIIGVKAKKAATIHGAEPNILPRYYSLPARIHAKYVKPVLARRMDRIFTVSETSKRYYAEHWGVDPERVSICYNAVDAQYRPGRDPEPVKKKYGIRGRYLFHVSKYSRRKNPDCILKAFRVLARREDTRDVGLVLAGSGWNNETVLGYLEREKLLERVVFTGFTPEDDLVALYCGAEAFLFPSRAEGFGMPNLEAMACACPVVTSRAFAIPEVVADGALLIDDPDNYEDLAAKALSLIQDRAARDDLIRKGLARAASFSWEESARTVLEGYRSLLADSARSGA